MSSKFHYPLFDAYFKYVEHTEPPMMFHRWSLLPALGAWLGRQYYLPFGDFRIFPNMYVMLMGDPGTRKSTAIKLARKIISDAGYSTFAGDKTSKEKFLMDLAGMDDDTGEKKRGDTTVNSLMMENLFGSGTGGPAREVFIVADEFNEFMGNGNLEFISLLGSLWDWDDENRPFEQRFKNSKSIQIYQPTISLLGGNTHANFAACFPPQSIGQGFLSRLLLVFSEPSGIKITFPRKPPEEVKAALVDSLVQIRGTVHGEARIEPAAERALDYLYRSFKGLEDMRFQHYSTRRFTHLLKLCMLCAAARCSASVSEEDVVLANTMLSFAEHRMPRALGEFGKAKNADVSDKIIALLADAPAGEVVKDSDIWKRVSTDLENVEMMQKILQNLIMAQKVQWVGAVGNSRGGYTIVKKVLKTSAQYVDYSLLIEAPDNLKGM